MVYNMEVQYVTNTKILRTHIVNFSIVPILGQDDRHGHPKEQNTAQYSYGSMSENSR